MTTQKTKKPSGQVRTVAVQPEMDGAYFLKIVLYLIAGSFWIKLTLNGRHIPLAIGLVIGLFFTRYEKFSVDRKIEYAILLVAMLVGYFVPFGLYVNLG